MMRTREMMVARGIRGGLVAMALAGWAIPVLAQAPLVEETVPPVEGLDEASPDAGTMDKPVAGAGEAGEPAPESVDEPVDSIPDNVSDPTEALASCEADLSQLSAVAAQCFEQVRAADPALEQTIDRLIGEVGTLEAVVGECEAARRFDRETNGRLNQELLACQSVSPAQDDPRMQEVLAEMEALRSEIEALRSEVGAAEERAAVAARRLSDLGFSLEPDFALFGGTMRSSYLERSEIDAKVSPEARLSVSLCPQTLDWLASGAAGEWFALAVWVWEEDDPLICTQGQNGPQLREPDFNDAAHVVAYR